MSSLRSLLSERLRSHDSTHIVITSNPNTDNSTLTAAVKSLGSLSVFTGVASRF